MDDQENWLYNDAADVFDRDRAILEDEEQNGVRPSKSCMDVADEISAIPARESQSLEVAGTSKVAKKSYTIARKLEIVDFALKVKSIHSAAKKYNVDRKMIRVWMKKENQLRITEGSMVRGGQKKNLPGAGPPLKDEMFDKRLAAWVRDNRNLGIKVTRSMMVDKAQKMFQPVFGPETETTFNITGKNGNTLNEQSGEISP
ncbi:brinker DNA-binding domain-containing protein [Ditylenchus destructor]|nr:brinker DNA-binding domain-containing protein [Ditylenchus destructor]